jgi:chemotaxis receptor (MCP) glutamine deamidase CheD
VNDQRSVIIHIGGVYASRDGAVVKTLLGSCIAACVWDLEAGVGGMNHFMLPAPTHGDGGGLLSRFGVHAMELLIGQVQKLGGDRRRLQAKVFGGGHVLQLADTAASIPAQNIRFIKGFMTSERIPLAAEDLGGTLARQVMFHTDNGKAFVRRLPGTSLFRTGAAAERPLQRDAHAAVQHGGEITLFDD